MNDQILDTIKSSVREKQVYRLPQVEYQIKLNQNENPYDLPADIKQQILDACSEKNWNRYPQLGSVELRKKLGNFLQKSSEEIMVGNGSNEIILAIMNAILQPGKKMAIVEPTFSLYRHCGEILNTEVLGFPMKEGFLFPIDEIAKTVQQPQVTLTILNSPNNPTGNTIDGEDLVAILQKARGIILLDEAYCDFCAQDFVDLIDHFPNLIVTRTFSKAYAFSWGRFGYAVANPQIVQQIHKVLLPYNLNGFTEVAASILLQYREELQLIIVEIIEQRQRLFEQLSQLDAITVYPSEANFLLVKPVFSSNYLFEKLLENGILVRDVSYYPGLGNHLRITIGNPEENDRLLEAMKKISNEYQIT